ncbi:MAG: phosphohistidine phosphatase SixA [Gammaproteobacteria bacterium]|jgi:phosphohistidine phosphatase
MKLYLVQHGEAVGKDVDPERPLSEQGERDIAALAAFLQQAAVTVERLWHSGKLRARQSAELLARRTLPGGAIEPISGIRPNDSVTAFARDADVWEQDTLVVGHLPFQARLVALLVTGDPDREVVSFRPGSMVCLERGASDDWTVVWMLRPELLARTAGPT